MAQKYIYVAGANPNNDLDSIKKELTNIEKTLTENAQIADIQIKIDNNASRKSIFDYFSEYQTRIAAFHYAGHADPKGLVLTETNPTQIQQQQYSATDQTSAESLALLFSKQKNLKFMFLNGCETFEQAQQFKYQARIPNLIVTTIKIPDAPAQIFATRFYTQLAKGNALKDAYDVACAEVHDKINYKDLRSLRDFGNEEEENIDNKNQKKQKNIVNTPQEIWISLFDNPDWRLYDPFDIDPFKVFLIYDKDDETEKIELAKHIKLLERQKVISTFDSEKIDIEATKTTTIAKIIANNLKTSDVILLLISPSSMCNDETYALVERAMEQREEHKTAVIPILLRHTDIKGEEFSKLVCLPRGGKFIYPDLQYRKDEAYTQISQELRGFIEVQKQKQRQY